MLKLCVKQSANILNGWSTTPNRALAAFWLKMSAENDHNMQDYLKDFMAASLHSIVSNMKNVSKII